MSLAHPKNPFAALVPSAQAALVLLAALGVIGLGTHYVSLAHEARASREALCRAELRALRARNPYVERYVAPVDACVALDVVSR